MARESGDPDCGTLIPHFNHIFNQGLAAGEALLPRPFICAAGIISLLRRWPLLTGGAPTRSMWVSNGNGSVDYAK